MISLISLTRAQRFTGVAICVVALGAGASRPFAQDVKMDGYPAIGAPAAVTLIATGAEPRTKLRYSAPTTYKATMVSNSTASMAMDVAGMSMPPMNGPTVTSTADLAVTSVAANGDLSYTIAMGGMSGGAGADPTVAATLQGLDADIKTIRGTATISDRGVKRASSFDTSKVTNPQFKQSIDGMTTSLEMLSMPLPEEAVGVGARWEVRQGMASGGMSIFQKTVLEIVKIDGKSITLTVTGEQTAPPQSMSNPALPPGTEARLQTMAGTVNGTITLRLDELVPTSVTNNQMNMVMEISMGGQSQVMSMSTTTKTEVSPKKAGG